MIRVLFVFGTRPEAIKMAPVVLRLAANPAMKVEVCVTAQHRAMLDQVLAVFGIQPDYDLNVMQPGQTLAQTTARIVSGLESVLAQSKPDLVLVQGDTTTTLCGALAAFYARIPVGHIEAGLRTGDLTQPFPEEMNRVLTGRITTLHFAATQWAADNLIREGFPANRVWVTGNSGIDAVLHVRDRLVSGELRGPDWQLDPGKKLIVVTAHRRESFGAAFESICQGLLQLADRGDVQIIYPVHRNPNVMDPVYRMLDKHPAIRLIDPLDYVPFVDLMRRAYVLITDSGGVQEEGPSLGKPILVMRDKTERPEAVEAGTVQLVGPDRDRIVRHASHLLDNPEAYQRMTRVHNPYGDGQASTRIEGVIRSFFDT